MARKVIKIDTYIGSWGYNKNLLRYDLQDTEKDGALLEISSLGGSLFEAIDMHNQLVRHGNVEVVITGPTASAATIIALGAKNISILDNAFFLIHKVMSTVDNWGNFNEDELDKLIQDLQTLRTENQKFDQVIARIYQKKTGKPIDEILNIMKRDTWMTADEAVELGFVDMIMDPAEKYNWLISERFVAMVKGADLPDLPAVIKNQKILDMKQFEHLNRLLDVGELQASDEGTYLNAEQLDAVNQTLSEAERLAGVYSQTKQQLEDVTSERDTMIASIAEKDEAIQTLTGTNAMLTDDINSLNSGVAELESRVDSLNKHIDTINAAIDAVDETVAAAETTEDKVNAIRTLLSVIPGAAAPRNLDKNDPSNTGAGAVDWKTINSLPHNQEADRIR
ncbi:MAG TPA: ATP-dependent Clp protease proteolytic subunit [Bacteroidales bacterium]|nr:ATP-dependent Clp protease proteolytic subunit [Bacteroidales bacterium]